LLDRLLLIELERVPEAKRRGEKEFWADFEAKRPRIFGALLDTLAAAMRLYPETHFVGRPRMADFAHWGAAAAKAAEHEAHDFSKALRANLGQQTDEVIESDPFALALREFMNQREEWTGTSSELLKEVSPSDSKPEGWPRDVRSAGKRLRVLQATLADVGIHVSMTREDEQRTRTVKLSKVMSETSALSVPNNDKDLDADICRTRADKGGNQTSAGKSLLEHEKDVTDIKDNRLHNSTAVALDARADYLDF
jgi:hypothetical protein